MEGLLILVLKREKRNLPSPFFRWMLFCLHMMPGTNESPWYQPENKAKTCWGEEEGGEGAEPRASL